MKAFIFYFSFLLADDGHNEDCKDIESGTRCELDCEAVNKEQIDTIAFICFVM